MKQFSDVKLGSHPFCLFVCLFFPGFKDGVSWKKVQIATKNHRTGHEAANLAAMFLIPELDSPELVSVDG